jgi:Na+-translocating ferredoxin:NAD+ oxidoreductase RnfG subunit
MVGAFCIRDASAEQKPNAPTDRHLIALVGKDARIETMKGTFEERDVVYFRILTEKGEIGGYVFRSVDFAPGIRGYGGPVLLLVRTNAEGVVEDFVIVESSETKAFVNRVMKGKDRLLGENIFHPESTTRTMDAVSGATFTSNAIIKTLRKSGSLFYSEVIGKQEPKATRE